MNLNDNPVVGQGAFGPPGPVVEYQFRGPDRGQTIPITDPFNPIDVAISPLDGTGWAIRGGALFHQLGDGTIVPVLDLAAYQLTDPDPVDQEGVPNESNPYGLAVMANGDALVADAAGNDLIRVTPSGEATTMARFDVETISTDHTPPKFGLPPEWTAEAVPTSVAIGSDGAVYVGELKGFPFQPGSSHVWRIDPDADGALCSVNTPQDDCTVAAADLTAIQDIAINVKNDNLYVPELAADGVLAFEEGFTPGVFRRPCCSR
ncbi:MAG: ScyD/ScyE family protein [Acidimicrobiales bacterium]